MVIQLSAIRLLILSAPDEDYNTPTMSLRQFFRSVYPRTLQTWFRTTESRAMLLFIMQTYTKNLLFQIKSTNISSKRKSKQNQYQRRNWINEQGIILRYFTYTINYFIDCFLESALLKSILPSRYVSPINKSGHHIIETGFILGHENFLCSKLNAVSYFKTTRNDFQS